MKKVVFLPRYDAAKMLFIDLFDEPNTACSNSPLVIKNIFLEKLIRLLYSYKLFFILKPICRVFFKKYKKSTDDYMFIFFNSFWANVAIISNYITYIKKKVPNSRFVMYFLDVHVARDANIKKYNEHFDEIFIFDKKESHNLNIKYYPLPYSKRRNVQVNNIYKSDIAFVGKAKNRYGDLIEIFEKLYQNDIICNFYITGVPEKERKYQNLIKYGNEVSSQIAFDYLINTKVVLELKLKDSESYSNRVLDAIAYNKKILTNNVNVKSNRFYNHEFIQIYKNIKDIEISFFKNNDVVDYKYNNEFSPCLFIDYLENTVFQ